VRPVGAGELLARFQALKQKLQSEGLFAPERKRPVPHFPRRLGVVTSPTGAAIRDILHVLRRRYPLAEVILAPTLVQGEEAPPQIVAAIDALNTVVHPDTIIVARGGGSMEELWAFNDERVARAIFASQAPVISGVGHETDFTIADFVADVRAPTPSAAAEIAVPDQRELRMRIRQHRQRLGQTLTQRIGEKRSERLHAEERLRRASPATMINHWRQGVDDCRNVLCRAQRHRLSLLRECWRGVALRLQAVNPGSILARGYAIVSLREHGTVVRSTAQVGPGTGLDVRIHDGHFGAVVD
jgi:exodeoxyribonuclease VII large subunit